MSKYGLIFDNDGIICDTEAANARATIRVFRDMFGLEGVRPEDFTAGIGRGAAPYVLAAANVQGLRMTDQQVQAAVELRQDYFLADMAENRIDVFPGVRELIDAGLDSSDFSLAIATSADLAKSRAVLVSTCVPFEKMVYVTGTDVENKKPHPDLFLKAAEKMALAPERCAVIEDSPDGVAAAVAAQMACVAVTNTTTRDRLSKANLIVDSLEGIGLDQIAALIERRRGGIRKKHIS